jgi:hypothetical protein
MQSITPPTLKGCHDTTIIGRMAGFMKVDLFIRDTITRPRPAQG